MWEACTRHVLEVRKRDSRLEEEALQSWVAESGDMVSAGRGKAHSVERREERRGERSR